MDIRINFEHEQVVSNRIEKFFEHRYFQSFAKSLKFYPQKEVTLKVVCNGKSPMHIIV